MTVSFRNLACSIAAICLTALTATSALADLANLEAAQASNPAIQNQWKFEGSDDTTRLKDSVGASDLTRTSGSEGGDINAIIFEAGVDGAGSQAYRPGDVPADPVSDLSVPELSYRWGAGLSTDSFTSPAKITLEAVVKGDAFRTERSLNYIFSTRPGGDRGYYLTQRPTTNSRIGPGDWSSTVGDTFSDAPAIVSGYTEGDWYYLAATIDLSAAPGGPMTFNGYYANLSNGDTTLTHMPVDNMDFTGAGDLMGATGVAGIGMFSSGQEFLQGAIDNLAVYGDILSSSDLQAHLDAFYVAIPEPSSLLLLGLGGIALAGRCRRVV